MFDNRGNGWDYESGKSNNAVDDECNGNYPASIISKETGLSVKAIKEFFDPVSWHHTSKYYNKTEYYSLEEIQESLEDQEFRDQIKAFQKQSRSESNNFTEHKGCTVKYLNWYGTRKNPRASEDTIENCTVKVKGETAYIYKNGKKILTKRLSTNGFEYTTGKELKARKRRMIDNKKKMALVRKKITDLLKGKQVKTTGYFGQFERDPELGLIQSIDEVSYSPISHKAFIKLFFSTNDSVYYAERAIEDFHKNGMARIGLHTLACLYQKNQP